MKRNGLFFLLLSFFWLIIAAITLVLMVAMQNGSIWAYATLPLAVFCSLVNFKRFTDCRGSKK